MVSLPSRSSVFRRSKVMRSERAITSGGCYSGIAPRYYEIGTK
jgi:hypothetical protein